MTDPQALGALANIHELQLRLVETLPPGECNRRFEHGLPSAGWLLGRAVYLELHLLRNRVRGDDDLASRVRHLFDNARSPAAALIYGRWLRVSASWNWQAAAGNGAPTLTTPTLAIRRRQTRHSSPSLSTARASR